MGNRTDRRNINGIRQGQRKAYEAVICQHYEHIYRFLVYLAGNADVAEDLTQETFAAAWANIDRYKGKALLRTWLHKIAYNKFIDSRRKLRRDSELINKLENEENNSGQQGSDPLGQILENERMGILYEAINMLKQPERIVIVLHYIQGLSYRQMAAVLDERAGTIKWRTSRAMGKLKVSLSTDQ